MYNVLYLHTLHENNEKIVNVKLLAPVAQRADNFIQWISYYPAVQMYSK